MRLDRQDVPPLYALTDPSSGLSALATVKELALSGAGWIQLRAKAMTDRDLFETAIGAKRFLDGLPAERPPLLLVNDRVDLALACGAAGVHLGDGDLPVAAARRLPGADRILLGYSTHDLAEALTACEDTAIDYVAIGPIFRSRTRNVREPLGLGPLRQIRAATGKTVVAIGGIDHHNAGDVLDAGADAVAVIAALYASGSIADGVARLLAAMGKR